MSEEPYMFFLNEDCKQCDKVESYYDFLSSAEDIVAASGQYVHVCWSTAREEDGIWVSVSFEVSFGNAISSISSSITIGMDEWIHNGAPLVLLSDTPYTPLEETKPTMLLLECPVLFLEIKKSRMGMYKPRKTL